VEELAFRLIRDGVEAAAHLVPHSLLLRAKSLMFNRQRIDASRQVADRHYNLDVELFAFLGRHLNYSCGYFKDTDNLDTAQVQKMDLICRKLDLRRSDRVADIGGGWGELARYAATHYRCHVTSINIAEAQVNFSRQYCKDTSVDVVNCDYRRLSGTYDKIAAIAMVAHVGYKNYRELMEIIHSRLSRDGIFLIETVGSNTSLTHCDPWIERHIFPRGMTPSLPQLAAAMEGLFVVEDLHNFAPHYIQTLRAWRRNFRNGWAGVAHRYGETTFRTFDYFFQIAAAAFRSRTMQYWHLVLTKTGAAQPGSQRAI
jgi:cyclopropane-fatty-acyl-phospholipid synthase